MLEELLFATTGGALKMFRICRLSSYICGYKKLKMGRSCFH
jgi:hypothetical protein